MRCRFIAEEAAQFPVCLLCRAMGVSRAGYCASRIRPPSARALADAQLSQLIGEIHDRTLGIYGAPRIHAQLCLAYEICVGTNAWGASCARWNLRCPSPRRGSHHDP